MSDITIREPASPDDLVALHKLLLVMGQEVSRAPVNPAKVMQVLVHAVSHPDAYTVLMAMDEGDLVGALCLAKSDFWYSDDAFLSDLFFFVLPQHRGGEAMPALIAAAEQIGAAADLQVILTINNPRRLRGSRAKFERVATLQNFVPAGVVLSMGESRVLRQQ